MCVSKLPFEILTQVADNLSAKDILSCSLTCKGWRDPFQKALWKEMRLYSFHGMQRLIYIIQDSQGVSTSYPHLAHSLCIDGRFRTPLNSVFQVSDLSLYLPNVKRLCLVNISQTNICTSLTKSHKIWKSLESLKVEYERSLCGFMTQGLFAFINTCTMLNTLEICDDGFGFAISPGVGTFDDIHQRLQHLSSIKAGFFLGPVILDALDTVPNTTPAFSVTSLDISSIEFKERGSIGDNDGSGEDWHPLWIYYFGYKYPNLLSLKLEVTDLFEDPILSDERELIISLFHANPNAFQHLETFDLTTDSNIEFSDFMLWELLCPLRVPLKHLTLHATNFGTVEHSYPMDIDRILQSFSGTLESLSVRGFKYSERNQDPTINLSSHYPLLTNLCISGSQVSLNLDDLLNKCVALEQLEYCGGTLVINSNTITEESNQHQEQHGLQILKLRDCSVAAEAFEHLSFRCKNLDYMDVSALSITGPICAKAG
ncbi:hypothetical protein J3Q64DRAFT_1836631 [Phycomyces blakesleeanus]|uniref:F-box domain-containing protein n=2 Tax=Phycomyces blakesleeanus TaxID=4837 RepID=A0A162UVV1_PHYB8|nr:hypothetical protein PHYBLDRAFT_140410 [Phycomyces blakesleeanus NRRL 1555(-)]OAD78312.1 hypothetical protein PHYBLDRAFT_140410 [Phycomyces blakesleeanus NRRL 1555(-)]|eukprot:XP_018296352.1 hypothetical protein PHYBLDRAFT_140410 [Phycomyces blakesleeanus NRRL 1555(-)]